MIPAAVVGAVFVLYVLTYARIPAGDGYWALNNITQANYELLFNPPSLLTQLGFFGLRRLADWAGLRVETLRLIQLVNAVAAGCGAALLYGTVRAIGGSKQLGMLAAALLAVSYGYWQFADGELQLLSLVVLLLIFWFITRARALDSLTPAFVARIALLNSLAALLRQENVIFGFAAVTLLAVRRPWRHAVRDSMIYAGVGAFALWSCVILVGLCWAPDVKTLPDAVSWYLWVFRVHVGATQDFQGFEHALPFDVARVAKGQLTALVVGTQAISDSIRDLSLLGNPFVVGLATLTLTVYVILFILILQLRRLRLPGGRELVPVVIGSAAWVVVYKLLLHGWLWPSVTKYQVVTIPPVIVLLVLGTVVAEKSEDHARRLRGLLAVLVALVFVVDLTAGILPWRRYGEMKVRLDERRVAEFRVDDLFVSCESGIDPIFARLYRGAGVQHIPVKDVFLRMPTPEAFAWIREAIDHHLSRGGRVFVYNFVPAPYSLVGMNQAPARGATPLGARDFEAFFDELRQTHAVRVVFTYWEESKNPLYLFGDRLEPFFEVRARS